jgi:hypothetical protein
MFHFIIMPIDLSPESCLPTCSESLPFPWTTVPPASVVAKYYPFRTIPDPRIPSFVPVQTNQISAHTRSSSIIYPSVPYLQRSNFQKELCFRMAIIQSLPPASVLVPRLRACGASSIRIHLQVPGTDAYVDALE